MTPITPRINFCGHRRFNVSAPPARSWLPRNGSTPKKTKKKRQIKSGRQRPRGLFAISMYTAFCFRFVRLLRNPGRPIQHDTPLCVVVGPRQILVYFVFFDNGRPRATRHVGAWPTRTRLYRAPFLASTLIRNLIGRRRSTSPHNARVRCQFHHFGGD